MSESRRMIVLDGAGTEVEPVFLRVATDDEVRAAVVPLLDLEASVDAAWGHGYSIDDVVAKHIVYAALGLGEES